MADDTTITDDSTLTVPDEVANQFPDLVELIKGSSSMDDEERQYWVDVLPIMSEDQIKNLRDILDNEKTQIEEANNAYAQSMSQNVKKTSLTFDEAIYKEKKQARIEAEHLYEQEERMKEEATLKELENL